MPLAARSICDLGLVGYDEGLRIQREHAESGVGDRARLRCPALLVELAAVREHDTARTRAVELRVD